MTPDFQSLPTLQPGTHKYVLGFDLPQSHYAAVTDSARRFNSPVAGMANYTGMVNYRLPRYENRIAVKSAIALPRWSIFQLYCDYNTSPSYDSTQTVFIASPVGVLPTPVTAYDGYYPTGQYAINQENDIAANNPGYATLMQPGVPMRVAGAMTPYATPVIGSLCAIETGNLAVSSPSSCYSSTYNWVGLRDLLCVSCQITPANYSATPYFCEVMWVPWVKVEGQFSLPTGSGSIPAATVYSGTGPPNTGYGTVGIGQMSGNNGRLTGSYTGALPYPMGAGLIGVFRVINRTKAVIPTGTYGRVELINGEWQIVWADC
jgi:hypothetical protein